MGKRSLNLPFVKEFDEAAGPSFVIPTNGGYQIQVNSCNSYASKFEEKCQLLRIVIIKRLTFTV